MGWRHFLLPWEKGVCILLNPASGLSINEFHSDEGRIVSAKVAALNKLQFSICNIYAPNNLDEQSRFAQNLNVFLLRHLNVDKLIIGGDWNVTLEHIDKKGVQDGFHGLIVIKLFRLWKI